jgi:hypothetical protein
MSEQAAQFYVMGLFSPNGFAGVSNEVLQLTSITEIRRSS